LHKRAGHPKGRSGKNSENRSDYALLNNGFPNRFRRGVKERAGNVAETDLA
jgi:hypothetical protein